MSLRDGDNKEGVMVKEQWEYGNPESVAIRKESQTCKGCAHEEYVTAFDLAVWICKSKDEKGKRRQHGRRCKNFRER